MKILKHFSINLIIITLIISGTLILVSQSQNSFASKNMDEKRAEFVGEKEVIIGELITKGDYTCCLKKPCTYCIEKTPGHGEGATCNCLKDIVEGRHPCGECMGEILEGHGNPYLPKYFAPAIAEEVGAEHLETLNKIIQQKYPSTPIKPIKADEFGTCQIDQLEKCADKN